MIMSQISAATGRLREAGAAGIGARELAGRLGSVPPHTTAEAPPSHVGPECPAETASAEKAPGVPGG
jgi:hypothetical protein